MVVKIRESSENIFRDIHPDDSVKAADLRTRSDLMIQIEKIISRRSLTQTRAAVLFGVSQPRISDLVRGKIGRFNVDSLIDMLRHAGAIVQVVTRLPVVRASDKFRKSA